MVSENNPNTPEVMDDVFTNLIQTYENPGRKEWAKKTANMISHFSKPILDVGCGTGLVLSHLSGKNIGMDFSKEALRLASARCPNSTFMLVEIPNIPLADSSVPSAICTEVLEHVDNPLDVAKEIVRVLEPGGFFFATVPDRSSGKDPYYLHINSFTPQTLKKLFSDAGFSNINIEAEGGGMSAFARKP